jgi:plastocyanin
LPRAVFPAGTLGAGQPVRSSPIGRRTIARAVSIGATAWSALVLLAGCGSSTAHQRTSSAAGTPAAGATIKAAGIPAYLSPSPSAAVQSGVVQIAYRDYAIDPDTLRVKAGSTIVWHNYDPTTHNVTSTSGPQHIASGALREGASFQVKLTKPGVIHYESTTTPATMNGTIQVLR